jgi:UDP-N-acetylmuramoyl-L-alanyl-D-glutamate--2,6-diaminopimelate ligase
MKLSALLQDIPLSGPPPVVDPDIGSLAYDSRRVEPGSLFFALPGEKTDGARYLQMAADHGAVAAIGAANAGGSPLPYMEVESPRAALARASARFAGFPSKRLKIIGITGTNGKTTTTFLAKHLLDNAGKLCGLVGTIHYSLGIEETPASHTTPESLELQNLLGAMVARGCKACAMEVSSHALVQHRADCIDFDVAVFTNLTQDHLDYHKTMEAYFEAKAILFDKLKESTAQPPRAVINADDRFGHRMIDRCARAGIKTITYGLGATADFQARNIRIEAAETRFTLVAKRREYLVRLPLIGLFNVYNALAALAAVSALGVELRAAVASLATSPQVPGRLQRVPAKRSFQVFVDYAHTPDALENVLRTVKELMPERLITVFGCGGDRDKAKRPLMAAAAEKYSDILLVTSDNPRTEDPALILRDIEKGFSKGLKQAGGYEIIEDRATAILRAIELAGPGDIVVIAGKGHENYQEVHGKRHPFDDVQQANWAIADKMIPLV